MPFSTTHLLCVQIESLRFLKKQAEASMEPFITTIEEDEKIKDTRPMYSNERNCVIMRLGEKKVLRSFIELADKCIPLLSLSWKELQPISAAAAKNIAAAAARKPPVKPEMVDIYTVHVVENLVKKIPSKKFSKAKLDNDD